MAPSWAALLVADPGLVGGAGTVGQRVEAVDGRAPGDLAGDELLLAFLFLRVGQHRGGEGGREHDDAVEAYMSAAYVAPDSIWARRALLGAGRSFAALKQSDAAVTVYRKLLASSSVEPDLATEAKASLKALGAN